MNGKKAKQLRKVGKLTKKDKRLYNTLPAYERYILGRLYDHIIKTSDRKTTENS